MILLEKDLGMEIDEDDWRDWSSRTHKGNMNVVSIIKY